MSSEAAVTAEAAAGGAAAVGSAAAGEDGLVCALEPAAAEAAQAALVHDPGLSGPRADCVLCGEPTELPADHPGTTLCPVCAWQQAQRIACSG
ncbi:hypothetical protein [Streptomyces sp. CB01881]|uniref:hypothetical protein n=1 Tax=Streptomyces sp. CB01881 TaxID=2078691 RepID=UPI0013A55F2D|nr:hypothetical protein [Streptomyces sp. CB01881]